MAIVGMAMAPGCATYYGGTKGGPVFVAERDHVIPLYNLNVYREPSLFDPFGHPVMRALVREAREDFTSAELKQLLGSIDDKYIIARKEGEGQIAHTLRESLIEAAPISGRQETRWVLSIEPVVLAITPGLHPLEEIPSWGRMYNPPASLIEEFHKDISVSEYVVVEGGSITRIQLERPVSLGELLNSRPWSDQSASSPGW